ncbi:hypothetical protein [Paenibacillus sp. GbtcB18]|uniref:hypothetical protein n=1 Tax=Paenibacillus sp. GbtcB18 TaxID=2824763 RepID=UPI001C30F3A7
MYYIVGAYLSQHSCAAKISAAIYVAYRAVRLAPSLLPPLWPTISANIAVP